MNNAGTIDKDSCSTKMPVIRESEGRHLVGSCRRECGGTMTVGAPQYVLSVTNPESPQPEPPTPPTPPVVPVLPSKATTPSPANGATNVFPGGLVLSWQNGGGATSYSIFLNGVFLGNQPGTSFSPATLPPSTPFSWRIDSLNGDGITVGDTWTFTTAAQVTPPTLPFPAINPSPANGDGAVDPTSVTLSWANGGGAISYDVYLDGVFQVNQMGTSFLVGALAGTTPYTWRIDSINVNGTTIGTTWSFTTSAPAVLPPEKPVNPTPANAEPAADPDATILSWDDGGSGPSAATSYDVYVNGVFQINQLGTTFNPGTLISFDSYTWQIDAVNGAGTTTGDLWAFDTTGHATVISWAGRVVTNGGAAPSVATKRSLHVFCVGLDTASLTASVKAVNAVAPDSLIAATTPLIVGPGLDPWTNFGFVGADLTINGLLGNGSSKYLKTGIFYTDLTANNTGFTTYLATVPVSGAGNAVIGLWDGGSAYTMFLNAGGRYGDLEYAGGAGRLVVAAPTWAGYNSLNRVSSTDLRFFAANSGNAHAQIGATLVTNIPDNRPAGIQTFFAWARNVSGGADAFIADRLSFVAIHNGLSSAQSSSFFTLVQALRVSFGGGFA